jgi:hypothetical protein
LCSELDYVLHVDPQVIAAVIAGALTVIGTLAAQYSGRRAASKDAEKALGEQREQLIKTFAEQREQLDKTLRAQGDQLDKTLAEQRTRTLNERFASAAEQLGDDKPAIRLAGVYAMAGLADDWKENRQTCVDVLCAYLRMPHAPDPGQNAPEQQRLAFQAIREVRHTVIRYGRLRQRRVLRRHGPLRTRRVRWRHGQLPRHRAWSFPPAVPWNDTPPLCVRLPPTGDRAE